MRLHVIVHEVLQKPFCTSGHDTQDKTQGNTDCGLWYTHHAKRVAIAWCHHLRRNSRSRLPATVGCRSTTRACTIIKLSSWFRLLPKNRTQARKRSQEKRRSSHSSEEIPTVYRNVTLIHELTLTCSPHPASQTWSKARNPKKGLCTCLAGLPS